MNSYKSEVITFDELTDGIKIKREGRIFKVLKKSENYVILVSNAFHKYAIYKNGHKWTKDDFNKARFRVYNEPELKIIQGCNNDEKNN